MLLSYENCFRFRNQILPRLEIEASERVAKTSDKFPSILSDQCGVKYTSTAKKVLSKSAAEEKMTTEAIKDVYWHGLNSQQPAHYFDPTVSIRQFSFIAECTELD